MPEYCELKLELKPHLLPYVSEEAGGASLNVSPRSELGAFVFRHLKYPEKGPKPARVPADRCLTLRISYTYLQNMRVGSHLSTEARSLIAQVIETLFWEDLGKYVYERMIKYSDQELGAMRKFREIYGISEELYKEESMYKQYQRWKQTRRKPYKTGAN